MLGYFIDCQQLSYNAHRATDRILNSQVRFRLRPVTTSIATCHDVDGSGIDDVGVYVSAMLHPIGPYVYA